MMTDEEHNNRLNISWRYCQTFKLA